MAEQGFATKQDIKEFSKEIAEDFRFGVVAEGLGDKIQIVAEGHRMLAEKMERMEERLDAKIAGVEYKVDRLDTKIDKLGLDLIEHRHNTEVHNINIKKGKG